MSDRYPGGLIRKTPPTVVGPTDGEGGSAPGIWTTDQVAYYEKEGLWPKPVLPRELYAWGYNNFGNSGLGDTINRSSPVQVGSDTDWEYLSQGGRINAAAIKKNGSLYAWGYNLYGAVGDSTVVYRSSPVQIGSLTTWSKVNFGEDFGAALKTDGTLWAWGNNNVGQLGQSDVVGRSSPVQIGSQTNWLNLAVGPDALHVLALTNGGQLWAWGANGYGQLGVGNTAYRSSPVQVGALTTWSAVGTTEVDSFAIKTDGTLWAWGRNLWGQLGQNDTIDRSSPVQVGALTNWSSIFTGENSAFFVKTDGTLWAVGQNSNGKLGLGDVVHRSSPVQVGALTDWSAGTGNREATLAIKTDGTLWVWGDNANGQLANNTPITGDVSSPIQIGSDTNWSKVGMTAVNGFMAATKG